jgi:hypothetical protein
VTAKPKALPRSLAGCADLLYKTREERYLLQREVDKFSELESRLKEKLIAELPKSIATGIAGKIARVQLETRAVPRVVTGENGEGSWPAVYAYIKRHDRFDLLHRRLNEAAVKETWAEGEEIPGIEKFNIVSVSCTALKGDK